MVHYMLCYARSHGTFIYRWVLLITMIIIADEFDDGDYEVVPSGWELQIISMLQTHHQNGGELF